MTPADFPLWAAVPVALLLAAAGLLALIGAWGLLRLPDFHSRMHAPTLGSSLALACVLLASLIAAGVHGQRLVLQEILIALLMVVTSPVSTILLMQAGIYRKRDLGGNAAANGGGQAASPGNAQRTVPSQGDAPSSSGQRKE